MSTLPDLTAPSAVMARLEEIERDLATRQNLYEEAAMRWFMSKRTKEHDWAVAFIKADGPVDQRKAEATRETAFVGKEDEALYESLKAVIRTLETRATIGMALLKSQGRA